MKHKPEKPRKLRKETESIRKEPTIPPKRPGSPGQIKLALPPHRVGDPLSRFYFEREKRMKADSKSKFNAGEHVWLADKGFKLAFTDMREQAPATIRRGEGSGGEMFSYGEIVALSGDFYERNDDLFYEKPAWYSWMYEENDVSDLKDYFQQEIKAIKEQMRGSSIEYPDFNIQFAWNAKKYMELAKDNQDHFGWHNMRRYCECHEWALDQARAAGAAATEQEADTLWRKSLFYNGFADHFLTDAFSSGHLRVPRQQIMDWGEKAGLSKITKVQEAITGFLSKLLHDQDGHRNTDHSAGEVRPEEDGLRVTNTHGDSWWTRCDGQLFINAGESSLWVRKPIDAVKESVKELLEAKKGNMPTGVFRATKLVPFPHPKEVKFTDKFSPTATEKIKKWISSATFYEVGVNEKNVKQLFSDLPGLMKKFRESISSDIEKYDSWFRGLPENYQKDIETNQHWIRNLPDEYKEDIAKNNLWIRRLPKEYKEAFKQIS